MKKYFCFPCAEHVGKKESPDGLCPSCYAELVLNADISAEEREKARKAKLERSDKKSKPEKPLKAGRLEPASKRWRKENGRAFVFTAAQNNTEINRQFFDALTAFVERIGARLMIGQFVYNKNGFQNGTHESEEIWFAEELRPYFSIESVRIAPDLVWCGELNILPTAKYPLSGLEAYTGKASSIVPTSKIALECVPTPKSEQAKILYGTGTVTQRNYIAKKTGQLADHAHNYGALVVLFDDAGLWHAYQIEADETGGFYSLDGYNKPNGEFIPMGQGDVAAINLGDLHAEKLDPEVLRATVAMLEHYAPSLGAVILHDTLDFTSRNHHNRQNPHFLAEQEVENATVRGDLEKCGAALNVLAAAAPCAEFYVVESNHDLALTRWLESTAYDFRTDPKNARLYFQLQDYVYSWIETGRTPRVLQYSLEKFGGLSVDNFTFLQTDESLELAGIELGYHGHNGANGSKGSPKQFQRLNRPMNTGHTHTPSIYGQVYTAGVMGSLDMGYNIGPSSWAHAHILTFVNGKRAIIVQKPDTTGRLRAPWEIAC